MALTRVEDINLRGTFDFAVEKYAARILPTSLPQAARRADVRLA